MITIKLNIKSISDAKFVNEKQRNYSFAFRKPYKNIDLINNVDYYNKLKQDFGMNDIEIRSLISEVKTKFNQIKTGKIKLENEIISLESDIKYYNAQPKTTKSIRNIFKSTKKLNYKNHLLLKDIVFGGKSLLRRLSFLNNKKNNNESEILKLKSEYQSNRLLPIFILGEANEVSNRFFKFDFINNKIIYKPKRGIKIEIIYSNYKSYQKILLKLQEFIDNKLIPITIRLSTNYICLIFNEEILNGYSININERTKEIKKINSEHIDKDTKTSQIKEVYKKYYREQEDRKLKNKLNYRYVAFDTNPDYIGCSILDKIDDKINIIYTFNYDLTEINNIKLGKSSDNIEQKHLNNKRKHGICHVWKDLFAIAKYYRCGYIVLEDLNLKNKNLDNKTANKKVNNLWYRELSTNLINKYCNRNGIIKIEVNPCYGSFIGNLTNNYVDSVNASIEIGRRGINKYKKNNFYPSLNTGTIMNTMSRLNKSRDVSFIKDCKNWVEMYRKVRESGLRYRTTMEDSQYQHKVVNNIIHSKIKKICFSKENCTSLHKIL